MGKLEEVVGGASSCALKFKVMERCPSNHITEHLEGCGSGPPSVVPFSVSASMSSKTLATLALWRAEVSVHAALSEAASCLPSSSETCLWSDERRVGLVSLQL